MLLLYKPFGSHVSSVENFDDAQRTLRQKAESFLGE